MQPASRPGCSSHGCSRGGGCVCPPHPVQKKYRRSGATLELSVPGAVEVVLGG